jgi:hypothetical protein
VSNEVMVVVYAIYTIVMTAFYFGEDGTSTGTLGALFCSMPGLLALSFLSLLQNPVLNLTAWDLWTAQGVANPLAVMRNFLIALCWALLALVVGVIIPPFRTTRQLLSTRLAPDVTASLGRYLSVKEKPENEVLVRSKLIHVLLSLHGKATLTMFEPRMWKNENLVDPLSQLLKDIEILGQCAILRFVDTISGGDPLPQTTKVLELCTTALRTNDIDDYASLKNYDVSAYPRDNSQRSFLTELILEKATKVHDSTIKWLGALNGRKASPNNSKEAIKNIIVNNIVWMFVPIAPYKRLLDVVTLIVTPSRWNLSSTIWALEYAAGYIALFCMAVYIPAWTDFGIGEDSAGLYHGWHLISYAFTWTASSEGTVKKGLSRFFGTLVGGFCGWVGVIVVSGSYDKDAEMNVYGIVAWLVLTNTLVMFFGLDNGPGCLMAASADRQYPVMYFTLTNALVLLDVYLGGGTRDSVTVNRIISTGSGCLMAILVCLFPPYIKGQDPRRFQKWNDTMKEAFAATLDAMVAAESGYDFSSIDAKLLESRKLRAAAMGYAKDGNMFKTLPFFRIDPKTIPLLEDMQVSEVFLSQFVDYASKSSKEDPLGLREHRNLFETALVSLNNNTEEGGAANQGQTKMNLVTAFDDVDALVQGVAFMLERLNLHDDIIVSMMQ